MSLQLFHWHVFVFAGSVGGKFQRTDCHVAMLKKGELLLSENDKNVDSN
jgi:hypothetical protein